MTPTVVISKRAECQNCHAEIWLVDAQTKGKNKGKGGQWVHAALPENVHPAHP